MTAWLIERAPLLPPATSSTGRSDRSFSAASASSARPALSSRSDRVAGDHDLLAKSSAATRPP